MFNQNINRALADLGEMIRIIRTQRGIELIALAERSHISLRELRGIEAGKKDFRISILLTLFDNMGMDSRAMINRAIVEKCLVDPKELIKIPITGWG